MSRFGSSIFCDDIRNEVGGKLSFIGCYNAVMFVRPPFPVTLPKLCMHFHIWTPHTMPFRSVVARCYLPRETVPVVEEQIEIPDAGEQEELVESIRPSSLAPRRIVVSASIILTPIYLAGPGLVRMRAVVDEEEEEMPLGSLMVQVAED
jgi:hypothetical protein